MSRVFVLFAASLSQVVCYSQALTPPPQDFVLRFQDLAAASHPGVSITSDYTMETWVYVERLPRVAAIVMGKRNTFTIGIETTGHVSLFNLSAAGVSATARSPLPLPLNSWTHIAGVMERETMRIYVNGAQVVAQSGGGAPASSNIQFGLGGAYVSETDGGNTFIGGMRQARLWSRALTLAEIRTFAARSLVGDETGLAAGWPMNEGSGETIRDISPNHFDARLVGWAGWARPAIYDAGPYWEYQPLNSSFAATHFGAVVDMGPGRKTVLLAAPPGAETPGPARAFRFADGAFQDVTTSVVPFPEINFRGPRDVALADFNGDGRLDVMLASQGPDPISTVGGQSRLFVQTSDGKFLDETAQRLPLGDVFTYSVAAADIDGDGDQDIYMGNIADFTPQLYRNDGTGRFQATRAGLPAFLSSVKFTSARFVDVNNDRSPDLVLGDHCCGLGYDLRPSQNLVLLNDGRGNFAPAPANTLPPKIGPAPWASVGMGSADFDNDGFTDLVFAMTDAFRGPLGFQLLLNNRDGTFRDASSQIPLNGTEIALKVQANRWAAWANPVDINGDGWVDIVTSGPGLFPSRLFLNQGGAYFVDATEALPPVGKSAQVYVADFDEDGLMDMFSSAGTQYFFARGVKRIFVPGSTGCTYTFNQPSLQFAPQGGRGTVNIQTGAGCAWTFSNLPGWITPVSASSGIGPTAIVFQVAANTGGGRAVTAAIAGIPFVISQTGGTTAAVGIANVASYEAAAISPGEVVAIFVQGQGPASLVTSVLDPATGLVATSLAGTRVLFNDIPAPMVYSSATQLAAIVPYGLAGATSAQVVVEFNGVKMAPVTMAVVPAVPGLFSANSSGTGQGAIQNVDGSFNSVSNPAARGSIVVLYGTGQGQTNPAGVDGRLATSVFPVPAGNVSVTFDGIPATEIQFKGPIPSIAEGFWQVNVRLPSALGPGTHAVKVSVDGRASQDNLTMVVK